MKPVKTFLQVTCVIMLGLAVQARAQTNLTTLHAFTGQPEETDSYPYARLILSGSTFYGTTFGNANSEGTVFKVNTNGTGFTVLYTFSGGTDGANPQAGLLLSNGILYGTTASGGSNDYGTIFSVSTSGTGFKVLHTFTGGSDGGLPLAGLVLSNGILYGTAAQGGAYGWGTLFKVTTGGTFTPLYSFTGGSDGGFPQADLVVSSGILYGTTAEGGSGSGTVFSFNPSNGAVNPLYVFTGGSDGGSPLAGLVLSGSTLYGTTYEGGTFGEGTIFSITTGGTFTPLYSFTGGGDGANPTAALVFSSGTLYGTASSGGSSFNGTVFSYNISNRALTPLHLFNGSDGSNPVAALTLSGSNTLYGTTPYGTNGVQTFGTLFQVGTNGSNFVPVYNFTPVTYKDGSGPEAGLVRSGNMMYGTTTQGGDFGQGTVFQVTIYGTLYKTLYSFTGGSDGANPHCRLVLSGSTLYGTAAQGGSSFGANGFGTVFKVNVDGSHFTKLRTFSGSDGSDPSASLALSTDGTTLYGTTAGGGSDLYGTIFKVKTDGTGFKVLRSLNPASDGGGSRSGLTLSGSTLLYGVTPYGGSVSGGSIVGGGTIFKIKTDGTGFVPLFAFPDAGDSGLFPNGPLVLSGSMLYGTTADGGDNDYGTVFSFNINSKSLTTLGSFTDGSDGSSSGTGLLLSGSTLYGTTSAGGSFNGAGTAFKIGINSVDVTPTPLCSFTGGSDGGNPSELLLYNGVLYGTTSDAGPSGGGTVFSLGP